MNRRKFFRSLAVAAASAFAANYLPVPKRNDGVIYRDRYEWSLDPARWMSLGNIRTALPSTKWRGKL